jgi:hypothetical protein
MTLSSNATFNRDLLFFNWIDECDDAQEDPFTKRNTERSMLGMQAAATLELNLLTS